MEQSTTRETRRASYEAILPKGAARRQLILETLGSRRMTASEITEELLKAGKIKYFNRNFVAPRLTEGSGSWKPRGTSPSTSTPTSPT